VRSGNATANDTMPPSPFAVTGNPGVSYWTQYAHDRNDVTGDYTGTTDEILQWLSCKWGIDIDMIRAC
jgi:hypothetical protein